MNNREKGFTYPFTLIIFLLFLLFFSVKVEQLLTERKMAHESMIILQEEYYYLSSVKKMEQLFQSGGPIPSKGVFAFSNGSMEYQTEKPIGTTQGINFTLRLHSGEITLGRGVFDTGTKRLIKWIEMK